MWRIQSSVDFQKRLKKYRKSHPNESANCLRNLNAYLTALQEGLVPQQIQRGYVHSEPNGIKALDQAGPSKTRKYAMRLYVYPDESRKILYVLTLGNKASQPDDLRHCQEFVKQTLADDSSGW